MVNRITILYKVLLVSVLFSCSSHPLSNAIETGEANGTINEWLKLWKTYDLNSLQDIFWDSPECSYFSSEKVGLIRGYKALIPHHEGFGFIKGGKTPAKSLWLEDQNLLMLESTCVVTAIWFFGDKSAPRDSVQNGPVTFVLLRDDNDEVKIGHTHFANY